MLEIDRAKQLLDQFEIEYKESEINPVGFKNLGYWPES